MILIEGNKFTMSTRTPRHAIYAGSFDPLTLGHHDIIVRGAAIFDRLTVGIGINPDKKALFTPQRRVELVRKVLQDVDNVDVAAFEGLTVEFARAQGATIMLRGVRSLTDIDAEFTMSLANRVLAPELETVFLMASEQYSHISSSLIKQIAQMGGSGISSRLRDFVPEAIVGPMLDHVQS